MNGTLLITGPIGCGKTVLAERLRAAAPELTAVFDHGVSPSITQLRNAKKYHDLVIIVARSRSKIPYQFKIDREIKLSICDPV